MNEIQELKELLHAQIALYEGLCYRLPEDMRERYLKMPSFLKASAIIYGDETFIEDNSSSNHIGTFIFDHEKEKEYYISAEDEKELDKKAKELNNGYRDLCIELQAKLLAKEKQNNEK